jgi:hypothetical protein
MSIQFEPSLEFNLTTTRFAEDNTPADTFADDRCGVDADTFADSGHILLLLFSYPYRL